jgi:catechol 2,3-dioxygenase-like lactoylglutathione lyase family enzyme
MANVSCQIGISMDNLESVTPHIPSKNMKESINFMVDTFGFESIKYTDRYSELISGNLIIGIVRAYGEPNEQSIYFRVKGVDELYSIIKSKLEKVKHKAPFDQQYGMREIHVVIPGTNTLLFIGSAINS